MLRSQDLILISDDWGRHAFSCQHLVEQLLPFNRVLWVNTIGYRQLKFTVYDTARAFEKIVNWAHLRPSDKTHPSVTPNLRILNPVCLPFGTHTAIREFNAHSVSRSVRKAVRGWNFQRPILITTLPIAADFIERLSGNRAVYYCVDDYTLWPGQNGLLMRELEERLLGQVDLVVATSEKLRRTRSNGRRQTALLTHGVDLPLFQSVGVVPSSPEIQALTRPIVGYYGLVDERCDLPLIATLARSLRDVTFLIIGSWKVPRKPLAGLSNVKLVGKVPYAELPAYLASVDLLMLPYYINELAESINPLKVKEYLATGLPVVSTPLPEVTKLGVFVCVASNPGEFVRAVRAGLGRGRHYSTELATFLQKETWNAKAEEFSEMIQGLL